MCFIYFIHVLSGEVWIDGPDNAWWDSSLVVISEQRNIIGQRMDCKPHDVQCTPTLYQLCSK